MENLIYSTHIETKIRNWNEIARSKQLIPQKPWQTWLIMAGRGFGKTRTGSESIMELINSGQYKRIAIIGKSIKEAKEIMIEGPSGILSTTIAQKMFSNKSQTGNYENIENFKYTPSKNQIIWDNGTVLTLFSGDNPDSLRGYQFDLIWIDEFAKIRRPDRLWEQINFTLRLPGNKVKCIITTTPKSLDILKKMDANDSIIKTSGTTFENSSNLSDEFLQNIREEYDGTFVGNQEIYGQLLMDIDHPVWKRDHITYKDINPDFFDRVVIGVDPAVTNGEKSDETGIIVAAQSSIDKKFYVIDDLSGKCDPSEWAQKICKAAKDYNASAVIAETNNGGDLVKEMLTSIDPNIPFKGFHSVRGKIARAQPVALLYESQKVYHSKEFRFLENQMCSLSYDPDSKNHFSNDKNVKSPDRVDALVLAITELKNNKIQNEKITCDFSILL